MFSRLGYEFSFNRVSMDVVLMAFEVDGIPNTMIRESSLPDFVRATNDVPKRVRTAAFDQLHAVFESNVVRGSEQEMNVFGHDDKSMQLKASFTAVSIQSLKEQAYVVLNDKHSTTMVSRKCDEVSSRRGDESYRLQRQTSAAKAAIFA